MGTPFLRVHFGHGFYRLHPTRRVRRYIDRLLVVFFDAADRFTQRAMQRRVVGEVLANRLVDAIELALDDAFFRLAAGRKQDVAVACLKAFFRARHGFGRNLEAAVQCLRRGLDGFVGRVAYQIERGDDQNDPK